MAGLALAFVLAAACNDGVTDDRSLAGGTGGAGGAAGAPTADGGMNPSESLSPNFVDYLANPDRNPLDAANPDAGLMEDADAYGTVVASCLSVEDPEAVCAGADCGIVAACCVGDGTCCTEVPQPPVPTDLDFAGCGSLLDSCVSGTSFDTFGPGEPEITFEGVVPNGDFTADSGVVLGSPVDLATLRADVRVTYTAPVGCGSSCLDTASVGFIDADMPVGGSVQPAIGMQFAPSRGNVNLLVSGVVADVADLGDGSGEWGLHIAPDGIVELSRNGMVVSSAVFNAEGVRNERLVVYGRSANLEQPGAIATVKTSLSLCDIPTSWGPREEVVLVQNNPIVIEGRAPSVATNGSETRVVWEQNGTFFCAEQSDLGSELFVPDATPVFTPMRDYESGGVRDPEIVWAADEDTWHLFYTAEDADGRSTIGHARFSRDTSPSFVSDSLPILTGEAGESLDAPGVYQRDGLWILTVRATPADEEPRMRAYVTSALNTGWERIESPDLTRLTKSSTATAPFEVTGDPSLIVHDSAYQLYFSRRVGTRWRVELLASDDLVFWRSLGVVLDGSGTDGAFDRLGALTPAALSFGDAVQLYYTGQDGVRDRLGFTERAAAGNSIF